MTILPTLDVGLHPHVAAHSEPHVVHEALGDVGPLGYPGLLDGAVLAHKALTWGAGAVSDHSSKPQLSLLLLLDPDCPGVNVARDNVQRVSLTRAAIVLTELMCLSERTIAAKSVDGGSRNREVVLDDGAVVILQVAEPGVRPPGPEPAEPSLEAVLVTEGGGEDIRVLGHPVVPREAGSVHGALVLLLLDPGVKEN